MKFNALFYILNSFLTKSIGKSPLLSNRIALQLLLAIPQSQFSLFDRLKSGIASNCSSYFYKRKLTKT